MIVVGVLASVALLGNLGATGSTVTTTTTVTGASSTSTSTASSSTNTASDLGYSSTTTIAADSSSATLSPVQLYDEANQSVVTLVGTQEESTGFLGGGEELVQVLGTGFVIQYNGSYYILTNYHVAGATSNLTVTFSDGNSYPATVIGSDPYADLAVVTATSAPSSEFHPLSLASSSSLQVGDTVVAIGNPYGLSDSMTQGIVSQLGQTIQDPTAGNFSIAGVIQFSAPINPGNSGGVLLDTNGYVVGIPTATVSGSEGIGFAIPSDTIIKELPSLIATGSYNKHSYLGISEVDNSYQLAQASGANVTYGVVVETVVPGGPAANAGIRGGTTTVNIEGSQYLVGGDIIISISGTKITDTNALGTYLEEHTVSGQVVSLGIVRADKYMTVNVTLGVRPPVSSSS